MVRGFSAACRVSKIVSLAPPRRGEGRVRGKRRLEADAACQASNQIVNRNSYIVNSKGSPYNADSHTLACMNVQVAVLCDAATDDNGKLNLLGSFDTIYAREMPATHPQCAVALRVTFFSSDEGNHNLKLNFVNADGRPIMPPLTIPVEVTLPDEVHFGTRNFIFNFQQLKFDEPGLYSMDITLDELPQASIPLFVKHLPTPPPNVA